MIEVVGKVAARPGDMVNKRLETGEVDLVDGIDPDAAERLAATGRVSIASVGARGFYYLGWNFRNPIFADRATRLALSLAIDRELMVATLLKGYGRPASSGQTAQRERTWATAAM